MTLKVIQIPILIFAEVFEPLPFALSLSSKQNINVRYIIENSLVHEIQSMLIFLENQDKWKNLATQGFFYPSENLRKLSFENHCSKEVFLITITATNILVASQKCVYNMFMNKVDDWKMI